MKAFNPVIGNDGIATSSTKETIEQILKYHFPLKLYSENTLPISLNRKDYFPISNEEIESALAKIKPNKAPGIDNIPGEIIKEIYFANKVWFGYFLNYLLRNGNFPTPWKLARVVLIPKAGKSLVEASHYRPICLLPTWGKLFDRIITDRLIYYLDVNNVISPNQFGFRKGRSTITALQKIKNFIKNADSEGNITCLISIDIKNAFNSIDWQILKQKINRLPLPSYLIHILFDFLSNRFISADDFDISYNMGIPQGSCLGPALWNIFINDLLEIDFGTKVKIQAFADDLIIMMREKATYLFKRTSIGPLEVNPSTLYLFSCEVPQDISFF
ncbi:RNA-directed DNA polymerase from mobile element jockey [Caerostris darwini]|uniref:RNA-directed DNA polymerase from mobile element jockey n=1 Tax=Caerostris darwini TaxID=1538125 RepID=A0AAV4TNM1_9ARAC|nr:RNA-directed DNA polymerase from mobile element jockey [Caerostris darwini]